MCIITHEIDGEIVSLLLFFPLNVTGLCLLQVEKHHHQETARVDERRKEKNVTV